jgi:hypothetical protein
MKPVHRATPMARRRRYGHWRSGWLGIGSHPSSPGPPGKLLVGRLQRLRGGIDECLDNLGWVASLREFAIHHA